MGLGTDARVTFKRRHCYATRSNKIRKFRTPGGKISIQYLTKKAKGPACAVSAETLQGVRLIIHWASRKHAAMKAVFSRPSPHPTLHSPTSRFPVCGPTPTRA